jgi:hypothetical protein
MCLPFHGHAFLPLAGQKKKNGILSVKPFLIEKHFFCKTLINKNHIPHMYTNFQKKTGYRQVPPDL